MSKREFREMRTGKKRQKYGAKRTESGFDSRKEERRYHELLLMERAGEIRNLSRQVPFALKVKGVTIGKIVIDHVYETKDGRTIYEDTKAINKRTGKRVTETPFWRWKARHLSAQHGITIVIWE